MSNKDNNTPPSIPTSKSSLCIVPEEKSSSEEHLISNNNSKKVLLVMAIGLRDKDGNVISGDFSSNVYPSKHKSKWKPLAADILQEIKRRKVLFGGKAKVNSQMKLSDCCAWLIKNPLRPEDGVDFVLREYCKFIESAANFMKEENPQKKDKQKKWSGLKPLLRLIHCLTDNDEIKAAFNKSFTVMTRNELDGRKNSDHKRKNPWEMIASLYNDPNFSPKSTKYPGLHADFAKEIDLSFDSVKDMSLLDADKAKLKFNQLKNMLVTVKGDWEKSGNGDGCVKIEEGDDESSTYDKLEVIDGEDKKNFLRGKSPAVLYLWQKVEEADLMNSVTQMLDASVGIDTASAPNSNKKHKKSDDDGRLEKLSASIDNANKIAAETNKIAAETLTLSKKKLEQDEVHKLMEIIANLKVQLMTAEEKLIMQSNKSSPLAKFYLEKVNALKKEILERENYLTSVKGIECR